jgi:hypothetical protein
MSASHPALSAVVLVPRARLAALAAYGDAIPKDARAAIAREARRPGAFAYVAKRSAQARVFVVVAESADEARGVAESLFASDAPVLGVFRAKSAKTE